MIIITKDLLKTAIDNVPDQYVEILYKIIKAVETPLELEADIPSSTVPTHVVEEDEEVRWATFLAETYGCLADAPIERGEQGMYEVREDIR